MKCVRTDGDKLPPGAPACRYQVITQRQETEIVTQKICVVCGDTIIEREPIPAAEQVVDKKE